ncbi:DNA replication and repair protein RecF, partial [Staphylococcus aureus]|nr:DNA replication and repair protein RecF [Staphylococcus aureus]
NHLSNYQRLLKQKNHYLKQLQIGKMKDRTMLEVFNEQFSEAAANVTLKRAHFIRELEKIAEVIHQGITSEKESLKVQYEPNI